MFSVLFFKRKSQLISVSLCSNFLIQLTAPFKMGDLLISVRMMMIKSCMEKARFNLQDRDFSFYISTNLSNYQLHSGIAIIYIAILQIHK